MSCSNCSRDGGCETHKVPQRALIERVLAEIYPTHTWGQPDDDARFGAGLSEGETRRLGRALAAATRAPAFWRAGGPDDLCHFVYVLCVGREPALVDVRDGRAPVEADTVRERYLRVAFSTVTRAAAVQEVALELDREGDFFAVRELPQPGVYDGKLLKRMRAIVDLLQASGVEHLDFGLVDKPAPECDPGDYQARYGVAPAICNFLFYAQPARTSVTTLLPVSAEAEARVAPDERSQGRVAP